MTAETAPGLPAELEAAIDALERAVKRSHSFNTGETAREHDAARAALVAKLLVWCPTCEVERLTAALADAQMIIDGFNKFLGSGTPAQYRARIAELESHQRWVAVSDGLPTIEGNYLVRDFPPDVGADVMIVARDAINPGCWDYWLGPLPDLPARSEGT